MPEPTGYILSEPRLASMSEAEQIEFLKSLHRAGRPPSVPTYARPAGDSSTPEGGGAPSLSPDVFDPTDLYAPLPQRSEAYVMPNGKRLWIHPTSLEERIKINRQVLRELRAEGILRENLPPTEARQQEQEGNVEALFRGRVWQAVYCCRQGEAPDSSRVFGPQHVAPLRNNPGWAQAVEEIAVRSDALAEGKAESAILQEGLSRFFGRMERWLQTCVSRLPTDCGTVSREMLEDCASSVSALNRQGQWGTLQLQALSLVLETGEEEG